MRLIDLLEKIAPDTPVGIWNIDDKRGKCPTPQTYQKAKNIPWDKICNIARYEVMTINAEKSGGLLVKVYNKDKLERSMAALELAEALRSHRHD